MNACGALPSLSLESRARQSRGISHDAIYRMVLEALSESHRAGGTLVDIGCGSGRLWHVTKDLFPHYIGIDAVRYEGYPEAATFIKADLDRETLPLPDNYADVAVAVETIEHLENPRAFTREVVRMTRPGGLIFITTPNNLSFLSLLTLLIKQRFSAFQDVHYPAHLTALLEIDLRRMAGECGLTDVHTVFSLHGRFVGTPWHYPAFVSRLLPRACSDNLLLAGRKPDG